MPPIRSPRAKAVAGGFVKSAVRALKSVRSAVPYLGVRGRSGTQSAAKRMGLMPSDRYLSAYKKRK